MKVLHVNFHQNEREIQKIDRSVYFIIYKNKNIAVNEAM